MGKVVNLESQLEHLLAQDLSKMGYQARIRHQERIRELRNRCGPDSVAAPDEPNRKNPQTASARASDC